MNNKTFIVVLTILVLVSGIGLSMYLANRAPAGDEVKMENFPKQIGEWTSTEIPLTERDYQVLETRNLIMRKYTDSKGNALALYIVYSENNRKVSHPPEICLTGAGLTILEKSSVPLTKSIKAVKMLLEKADTRELVLYWYKAGDFSTDQYLKQQLKVSIDRLTGKKTSCAMLRLSTDVNNNNPAPAFSLLQSFCRDIEPLLKKYVP